MWAAAAVAAAGAVMGGIQASNAAKANAQAAEFEADAAEDAARQREDAHRRMFARFQATQRTGYAASGVTMEGSPLDVMTDSAIEAELDALNIRHQGDAEATALKWQSRLYRSQGKQAMTAGVMRAGTTLLSTGARYGGGNTLSTAGG